ncbi:unnamed protein product [Tilletia laevis]|uniref:Uncharacterized protein n=3 Tax=Tilletia TaxID=13289 RepID=A0A8X7STP4_9BASI|nr:hypothetical protein CF336_g7086 [Tilletia laevis]KAE8187014.1 hypothetical protein CF328_g7049 [Tilletia controversa]KAE8247381.1 hypothetical protein A4X03_0g7059 [Tilletia caries]KAE8188625.1 hypothetical protein CF335_g6848 [Tilletia laevis]KAE8240883.1 hypothetical protein A4X06_0g7754 [Tilletia controversa]
MSSKGKERGAKRGLGPIDRPNVNAKRARVEGGINNIGQSSATSSSSSAKKSLGNLPSEILHTILILSGNPSLVTVNRHFHATFTYAPNNVRAAYIIARLWQRIRAEITRSSLEHVARHGSLSHARPGRYGKKKDLLPPRIVDPRDLVGRGPRIEWSSEDLDEGSKFSDCLRDPLGFALTFPLCSSPVIDAFAKMLHDIPALSEIATMASINGRMRVRTVPARLVTRLVPLKPQSSAQARDVPRQQQQTASSSSSSPSSSRLNDLVSQLGQGPKAPKEALRTFLRVLFWHLSSHVEMSPTISSPADVPLPPSITTETNTNATTPLLDMCAEPCLPWISRFSIPSENSDAALLQAISTRNLWALRLIRRFERRPMRNISQDQFDLDSTFGWGQLQMREENDDSDLVLTYLVSTGWVDGLRYVTQAETPEEAMLESRVCNEIARVLLEEVIDPGNPVLMAHQQQQQQQRQIYSSTSAPNSTSDPAQAPATSHSILFARAARPVEPVLLTIAVREGKFEIVDYLMKEHGLLPDMQTLRALERVRKRRGQGARGPIPGR